MADGVGRLVQAVCVLLARYLSRCDDGLTFVLVDDKVVGATTIVVYVIAMREVIVNNTLFVNLAGFSQFNGLADTPLRLPTRNKSIFTNAQPRFLITERVPSIARTWSSDSIRSLHDHRYANGLITAVHQFAVANAGCTRALDLTALERFAVFVSVAAQLD